MSSTKGLGRGLDVLFGGAPQQEHEHEQGEQGQKAETSVSTVPITALEPNPHQPRRDFNEEALNELADSIREQGIMQPLLVRPLDEEGTRLQIVAGERRWRAAQRAGLEAVPVYIRNLTDDELMVAALIENLQREDLNPIEEAEALESLKKKLNLSQELLAERLGKSRPAIANSMRLLRLGSEAREDVRSGRLSAGHARCLLGIEDEAAMESLRQRIIKYRLTVRETEDAATFWRIHKVLPWDKNEAQADPVHTPRRKKSAQLQSLQRGLSELLGCRATVSGTEEQGRIALAYSNRDELQTLLEKLGVKPEEPLGTAAG